MSQKVYYWGVGLVGGNKLWSDEICLWSELVRG